MTVFDSKHDTMHTSSRTYGIQHLHHQLGAQGKYTITRNKPASIQEAHQVHLAPRHGSCPGPTGSSSSAADQWRAILLCGAPPAAAVCTQALVGARLEVCTTRQLLLVEQHLVYFVHRLCRVRRVEARLSQRLRAPARTVRRCNEVCEAREGSAGGVDVRAAGSGRPADRVHVEVFDVLLLVR